MALSTTEICIAGFSQSPYAENNSYSSNSIQAVGLVVFVCLGLFVGWVGFFSKMWNSGFGLSTSSESIAFLCPLGTTVRFRLKHTEIQGGCAVITYTCNASFLAICLCSFFLQNLLFLLNYIFMVFLMFSLENDRNSTALWEERLNELSFHPREQEVWGNSITVFQYLMAARKRTEGCSSQGTTWRQGEMGTSCTSSSFILTKERNFSQ